MMTGLQKHLRCWVIPAVAFLFFVGISFISMACIDRKIERDFRENAMHMTRILGQLLNSEDRNAEEATLLFASFLEQHPKIQGIRLYAADGAILLDAAPRMPHLPDAFLKNLTVQVEKLGPILDSSNLFQILLPLQNSRALVLFMVQNRDEGLSIILPIVGVSFFFFIFITFYFVWQSGWIRRELRIHGNAEIMLSKKAHIDEIFVRYSRSLILTDNIEEATTNVMDAVRELTGSRVGYAGYKDPLTGHLFCPMGSGQLGVRDIMKPDLLVVETFSGLWGEVLRNGHPLYANADSGLVLTIPTGDGTIAVNDLLSVPAMAGGTVLGQITIGDGREPYTNADLQVMEKLGNLFALAIRKAFTTKALQESENRFRAVFQTIPDGVLLNRASDHIIVDINDGFIHMSGFVSEEILGRTVAELNFWVDQTDQDVFFESLRSEGKVENLETRFRVKGGGFIHGLISASKTLLHGEPHILSVIRGIDHIRETESRLRKKQSFLSKVIETSPAGILAMDSKGWIILANQKISEILGMDIPAILDRNFYEHNWKTTNHDLMPLSMEELFFSITQKQQTSLNNIHHSVMNGGGHRIYFSMNAATLWHDDGELDMIVASFDNVSEQIKGENSLLETRGCLQNVLDNLPVILWSVDAEGHITLFEGKGTESLSIPEGGILGISIRDHYAELSPILQSIERILMGEAVSITIQIGKRYFEVNGSLLFNDVGAVLGASGVTMDVTVRTRAEADRIRLSVAIEHVAESIIVTDREGTVLYVNPAFERITGWHRDEVIGKKSTILNSGHHDKSFYQEISQTLLAGHIWQGYITNRKRDGSCYDEEVSISPILDNTGAVINFVAVKRDVSLERSLEKQLRQTQKMEAIGTLAGGIAHDFNNILFPIIGFTELALENIPSDRIEYRYLNSILSAAHRARELVWQILTYSRKSETTHMPISVHVIVNEALILLRASIPSTIEIRYDIEDLPAPSRVVADATQIHQVVMNLGTNAFHAMEEGGIMTVGLHTLHLAKDRPADVHPKVRAGNWQVLSVEDTGAGMDNPTQERIFDPYFTTKERNKGTGLGLSTVHGILKGCGGEIYVESSLGNGTIFRVYLPLAPDFEALPSEHSETVSSEGKGHILLVDDEALIVEMLDDMLRGLGYEVTGCVSSVEALCIFEETPEIFDLLITDQTMPKMVGTVLAEKIQAIRPDFPVLLCSGFRDSLDQDTLRKCGIVDCIMKPVLRKDIAKAVRMAMKEKNED